MKRVARLGERETETEKDRYRDRDGQRNRESDRNRERRKRDRGEKIVDRLNQILKGRADTPREGPRWMET